MGEKLKKFWAVILTAIFICTGIIIYNKSKGDGTATLYVPIIPRSNDSQYNSEAWGRKDLNLMNGYFSKGYNVFTVKTLGSWSGKVAYCIEPGTPLEAGDTLKAEGTSFLDNLPPVDGLNKSRQKELIGLLLYYGYEGNIGLDTWITDNPQGKSELSHYMATQLLIWEVIVGERDENFHLISAEAAGKDPVRSYVGPNSPIYDTTTDHYKRMEAEVQQTLKLPEFMEQNEPVTLSYNSETKVYEKTLTDGNGVLGNFTLTEPEGLKVERDGNTLKLLSKDPFNEKTIDGKRGDLKTSNYIVWTDGYLGPEHQGKQDVVEYSGTEGFSLSGTLKIRAPRATGGISLKKVDSEYRDKTIEGAEFTVFNEENEEICKMVETDEPGIYIAEDLVFGTYIVKETKAPEGYLLNETEYKAVIDGSSDPIVHIGDEDGSVGNNPETGRIRIEKTDVDDDEKKLSGAEFEYFKDVNEDGIIPEDGEPLGVFKEIEETPGIYETEELRLGTYLVREKTAPEGYLLDYETYKVEIKEHNETVILENRETTGKFVNLPETGSLLIRKSSEDGTLKGFKFKLIDPKGEEQILETDDNGEIRVKGLRPGIYVIKEEEGKETVKYVLPDPEKVEIKTEEETEVKFHNRLKPEEPKNPEEPKKPLKLKNPVKTSDPGSLVWYSLIGLSVGRMALWLVIDRRKQ